MNEHSIETAQATRSPAREQRHQAKSRQILEAAAEVFLEDGFAATSIDRIVERAGVSKRTIYNRYRSKEQIFIDILKMHFQTLFEKFDISPSVNDTLERNLTNLGISLLEMSNKPSIVALMRNISGESQRFPELSRDFFGSLFEKIVTIITHVLEFESRRGSVALANIRQAAEYYLNVLVGTTYNRVIFGTSSPLGDAAIEHQARRATAYFLVTYRVAEVDLLATVYDARAVGVA